jgi:hypothetical protein
MCRKVALVRMFQPYGLKECRERWGRYPGGDDMALRYQRHAALIGKFTEWNEFFDYLGCDPFAPKSISSSLSSGDKKESKGEVKETKTGSKTDVAANVAAETQRKDGKSSTSVGAATPAKVEAKKAASPSTPTVATTPSKKGGKGGKGGKGKKGEKVFKSYEELEAEEATKSPKKPSAAAAVAAVAVEEGEEEDQEPGQAPSQREVEGDWVLVDADANNAAAAPATDAKDTNGEEDDVPAVAGAVLDASSAAKKRRARRKKIAQGGDVVGIALPANIAAAKIVQVTFGPDDEDVGEAGESKRTVVPDSYQGRYKEEDGALVNPTERQLYFYLKQAHEAALALKYIAKSYLPEAAGKYGCQCERTNKRAIVHNDKVLCRYDNMQVYDTELSKYKLTPVKLAMKRLMMDYKEICQDPSPAVSAQPLESDIFTWHCNMRPSG